MSHQVTYSALNLLTRGPQLGDAANHTVVVRVDGTDVTGLVPTELGAGLYEVTLSDLQLPPWSRFSVRALSTTPDVVIFGENGVRTPKPRVAERQILYLNPDREFTQPIDLGVFGAVVQGTPVAQIYVGGVAHGGPVSLSAVADTLWEVPIAIEEGAELGAPVRVQVSALVDGRAVTYWIHSIVANTTPRGAFATGDHTLVVTVDDEDETLLQGVKVSLLNGDGVSTGMFRYTDTAGVARIPVSNGNYLIQVTPPPGFTAPDPQAISVPTNTEMAITLTGVPPAPTIELCNVAVYRIDQRGNPIPGVTVTAEVEHDPSFAGQGWVENTAYDDITDAGGRVILTLIRKKEFASGGRYRITAGGKSLRYEAPDKPSDVLVVRGPL